MLKSIAAALVLGTCLSGCVALGLSQAQSEAGYVAAATAVDVGFNLGKFNPENAGIACTADGLNYQNLVSTRNVADGVNYAPADNIHAKLQLDGSRLNPLLCIPV